MFCDSFTMDSFGCGSISRVCLGTTRAPQQLEDDDDNEALERDLATYKCDLKRLEAERQRLQAAHRLDLYLLNAKRERLVQDKHKLDLIMQRVLRPPARQQPGNKLDRIIQRVIRPPHQAKPQHGELKKDEEELLLLQKHDNETASFLVGDKTKTLNAKCLY